MANQERAATGAGGEAGGSLHRMIRGEIEGRILSGEWPPGHRVPAEHELMRLYGCSRMTVNKVLTELAADGLVERRRRAGTFVSRPRPATALLEIPDVKAEIEALGGRYAFRVLARAVRPGSAADRARLAPSGGGEVLAIQGLHLSDDTPFALEDRLVCLSAVPEARDQPFAEEPPGTWLRAHVPWSEAEHVITALEADRVSAEHLDVAPGSACLVLERRTWRGGASITASRTLYPAAGYRLVARFRPGRGSGLAESIADPPKNAA